MGLFVQLKFLTCADLRTAILRTIGGIFSPKDAGIDFWMFPTVTPPYLWGKTKTSEKRYFQLSLLITAAQQRQNVFRTTSDWACAILAKIIIMFILNYTEILNIKHDSSLI